MTGPLEPTNSSYAMAKLAGIEMCWAYNRQYGTQFIPVMPTNLYGPNDNFDLDTSHALPALIRKFHEAKVKGEPSVVIWGTGAPTREFLHVDDLAEACLFIFELNLAGYWAFMFSNRKLLINIGTGKGISIRKLALVIKDVTGYNGMISYDLSKLDGMPQKVLDVSILDGLGWTYSTELRDGIKSVYEWYKERS